jgi:hypothetical protein
VNHHLNTISIEEVKTYQERLQEVQKEYKKIRITYCNQQAKDEKVSYGKCGEQLDTTMNGKAE